MPIHKDLKRSPRDLMPVQTTDDKSLRFGVKSQQQFYLCDKDKKIVFAIEICPGNTTHKFKRVCICVMIAMNSVASNCFGSCATVRPRKERRSVFYTTALPRTKNDRSPVKCILSHFGAKCVQALVSSCVLF